MVLKTTLLAALMYVVVRTFVDPAMKLGYARPGAMLSAGAQMLLTTFGWAVVIYVVMALVDYAHEHYEFMKQQRMSIEDLRQEHKEAEGDPINRSRRRSASPGSRRSSAGSRRSATGCAPRISRGCTPSRTRTAPTARCSGTSGWRRRA